MTDICMRMLAPRELYTAQGFPRSYIIERDADGNPLTKTAQVRMCGNSVPPPMVAALVRANGPETWAHQAVRLNPLLWPVTPARGPPTPRRSRRPPMPDIRLTTLKCRIKPKAPEDCGYLSWNTVKAELAKQAQRPLAERLRPASRKRYGCIARPA